MFIPPSGFHVVPVLAYSPDPGPVAVVDESETAIVARVPVRAFINPENRLMVYRKANTRRLAGPAFLLNEMLVWGFTGQVISAMLDVAGWAQPWNTDDVRELDDAMALSVMMTPTGRPNNDIVSVARHGRPGGRVRRGDLGWRSGALGSLLSFIGVVLGAVAGVLLAPHVVTHVTGTRTKLFSTLFLILGLVVIGEIAGVVLGRAVRGAIRNRTLRAVRLGDRRGADAVRRRWWWPGCWRPR